MRKSTTLKDLSLEEYSELRDRLYEAMGEGERENMEGFMDILNEIFSNSHHFLQSRYFEYIEIDGRRIRPSGCLEWEEVRINFLNKIFNTLDRIETFG